MRVQQAALSDYGSILAFYDDVIDRTPEIGRHAWWQKGKHPTAEGVRAYIEEGSMYLCRDDRAIIAVMALTPAQRLYERLEFVCRGRQHLMAENTGWTDFLFYEY